MSNRKHCKLKSLPTQTNIATVESLSHDGRGIAHINGKITFIDGALPGETVELRYSNLRKQFDEAYTVAILQASSQRQEVRCKHFDICGGCSLQHLDQTAQLNLKQETLLQQLKHFGGIKPQEILPPLIGPLWGYRRKARLSVRYVKNKQTVLVGFREKRSNFIANIATCEVLHPKVAQLITPLKLLLSELNCKTTIPQIEVAVDDRAAALVIRHLEPLIQEDLQKLSTFAKDRAIYLYLQAGGLDSVKLYYPQKSQPYLNYHFAEYALTFSFLPTDFFQVNLDINQQMIQRVLNLLNPQPNDKILDLFCGFGNFTLPLSRYCSSVIGIEGAENAVQRAQMNANNNEIFNAEFYCHDLTQDFSHLPWAQMRYDKVLIDPPRSGAEAAIKQLAKLKIPQIIYVSCNPATLARDAGILTQLGYACVKVGIMDMFPHTSHVESIMVLSYG